MKRITKVVLHNFRSHDDTEVDFTDFTTITGPTDAGKSAIIKGIVWALYNEPSGDRMIQWNKKEGFAEVHFDDGSFIRRSREGSTNFYRLTDPSGKVAELESFGMGTVKMVEEFHGMPKVDLFGYLQSMNVCSQFEAPFFLSESPRKRASMIGHIAGTDIIDKAYDNTNLDARRKKVQAKDLKEAMKEKVEKVKPLHNALQAEAALPDLKKNAKLVENAEKDVALIGERQSQLKELRKESDELKELLDFEAKAGELNEKASGLTRCLQRLDQLMSVKEKLDNEIAERTHLQETSAIAEIKDLDAVLSRMSDTMERIKRLTAIIELRGLLQEQREQAHQCADMVAFGNRVEETLKELSKGEAASRNLSSILTVKERRSDEANRMKRGLKIIEGLKGEHRKRQQVYEKALKDNGMCPLCLTPVGDEMLNRTRS